MQSNQLIQTALVSIKYQQNQDKEFPNEITDCNHGLSVFVLLHKNQTIISVRFTPLMWK